MAESAAAQACGAFARARAAHQGGAWGHEPGLGPGTAAAMDSARVGRSPQGAAQLSMLWVAGLEVGTHSGSPSPYGPAGAPALPLGAYAAPRTRRSEGKRTAAGVRQPAQLSSRLLPSSCGLPFLHWATSLALAHIIHMLTCTHPVTIVLMLTLLNVHSLR